MNLLLVDNLVMPEDGSRAFLDVHPNLGLLALAAAALAAGIGAGTTSASAQQDIASETARSVINGIILGGKVGPDFYSFVPANIESRLMASEPAQIATRKRPGYARLLIRNAVQTGRVNRVVNAASAQ